MTDAPAINIKIKALELASIQSDTPANTVIRANAYHAFLAGTAAPASGGATAGAANSNKTPPAGKPGTGTAGAKPGAATPPKDKPAGATPPPKDKPAGATPPKAGATAGASAGAPAADTKAPGGKYTYADVVNSLRKVKDKSSKDDAVAILAEDGGGAKSVRDLKPALYDAVVEACENTLNSDGAAGAVEDPTAQGERDELGLN